MKWEYKIANLDVGGTTKHHLDEKDNKRLNEWGGKRSGIGNSASACHWQWANN